MNTKEQAYKAGVKAVKENGEQVPAFNEDVKKLTAGLKPGEGSYEIMMAFREGTMDANGL